MKHRLLCTDDDKTLWKKARRYFVTASDLAAYIEDPRVPSYYSTKPGDIIEEKLEGRDRVFPPRSLAPIAHGSADEANNMVKASKLFGRTIAPFHWMVTHDRWPWLSCTLDGLGVNRFPQPPNLNFARQYGREDKFKPFPTIEQVAASIDALNAISDDIIIVEMKQTDQHSFKSKDGIREWIDRLPPVIEVQVQVQMHFTGLDHALVVGQLGASQMTGYVLSRDWSFEDVLDEANKRAAEDLASLEESKRAFLDSIPIFANSVVSL